MECTYNREQLDESSIITIEDYQQNFEDFHMENPTSTAYSTNKITLALYPICIEYKVDGVLHKGAVVFISDDKNHDVQQVAAFEERMFEVARLKIPHPVRHWQRWTDGCGEQFRSRFTNSYCMEANKRFNLDSTSWEYFEAHEGKNTSDTLGSIVKCAFPRALVNHPGQIRCAKDVVNVLTVVPESTEKFTFFIVEEFPEINRIPSDQRSQIPLQGIMSMHSIKNVNGSLLPSRLTCTRCTPSLYCQNCLTDTSAILCSSSDEEFERVYDQDIALSDDSDDDSDEAYGNEDEFRPGDVVWAKYQKVWYPAKVALSTDLPSSLKKKLQSSSVFIPVIWYGENKFSLVQIRSIDHLSQNRIDEARASVSDDILIKYNMAVSDLRND